MFFGMECRKEQYRHKMPSYNFMSASKASVIVRLKHVFELGLILADKNMGGV